MNTVTTESLQETYGLEWIDYVDYLQTNNEEMNKDVIILALETLREQVIDSDMELNEAMDRLSMIDQEIGRFKGFTN